jgi:hypothetical protein
MTKNWENYNFLLQSQDFEKMLICLRLMVNQFPGIGKI